MTALIQIKAERTSKAQYCRTFQGRGTGSMTAHKLAQTSVQQCPQAALSDCHTRILGLCSQLEEFADALPNRLEPVRCSRLAGALLLLLRESHRLEEQCGEQMSLTGRAAESCAQDIAEALNQVADIEPLKNPEALGFMLRSFFETQRRHVAFEQKHVLPALASRAKVERDQRADELDLAPSKARSGTDT